PPLKSRRRKKPSRRRPSRRPMRRKAPPGPPKQPKSVGRRQAREAGLPSREEILRFVQESAAPVGKREIARAFNVKGDDRIALRRLIRDIEQSGAVVRGKHRRLAEPGALPEMAVLVVTGTDRDGEVLAKPLNWPAEQKIPHIVMVADRDTRALG